MIALDTDAWTTTRGPRPGVNFPVHSAAGTASTATVLFEYYSDKGAIKLNDLVIPALSTRRAETTVEFGSGQSFAIGGLISNTTRNNLDKVPALGDLPVLGTLFRSTRFQRSESELVIIVTPYLVAPVGAGQLATPRDGARGSERPPASDRGPDRPHRAAARRGARSCGRASVGWSGPAGFMLD